MSLTKLMLTRETLQAHRATWWVYTGGTDASGRRERIRRTAQMRGTWPGYDVTCSCGEWESRTGGATRTTVEDALFDHRLYAQTS